MNDTACLGSFSAVHVRGYASFERMNDPSRSVRPYVMTATRFAIATLLCGLLSGGGSSAASEIQSWVQSNFTATTVGSTTVYKLTT